VPAVRLLKAARLVFARHTAAHDPMSYLATAIENDLARFLRQAPVDAAPAASSSRGAADSAGAKARALGACR